MMKASDSPGHAPDDNDTEEYEQDKSSSTEGPDSPDASLPSSPVPAMMSSSPGPTSQPPRYSVRFTDNVSKDGDTITYTINVRKLGDLEDIITITRQYEDLQYLDHQLTQNNRQPGLILPPLPTRPGADPAAAELLSRKQLGSSNRAMVGDGAQWGKDCRSLEKYLELVVSHPVLGSDNHLIEFLEKQEPPPRPAKLKKGWLAGVKDRWDARNVNVKDCDEWFGKEREWAARYGAQIRDASDKMNIVMNSKLRLVAQLGHLSATLNASVAGNEGVNGVYNKLNCAFSTSLDSARAGIENEVSSGEATLGGYLDMYTRCLEAENSMLLRRTCLLVDYENACKALAKAKPNREVSAKAIRDEAEKELNDCTQVARKEVKVFHNRRLAECRQSLLYYVEGQIKCFQENHAALNNCVDNIKSFQVPQVKTSIFDED